MARKSPSPFRGAGAALRVRVLQDAGTPAHGSWYDRFAARYDVLFHGVWNRPREATAFLRTALRRHHGVQEVLDVACGTFSLDLGLVRSGYAVVGRDLSPAMVRATRRALRDSGLRADVAVGDMRDLRLGKTFDAVLCLGTAFNSLVSARDVGAALRTFHRHLRPGGILILVVANFAAWVDHPKNARAEVDRRLADGSRVAVFGFNEQDRTKSVHFARILTVVHRGSQLTVHVAQAPLRIWRRRALESTLRRTGFTPVECWGDLRPGVPFRSRSSPRLVIVATRRESSGTPG